MWWKSSNKHQDHHVRQIGQARADQPRLGDAEPGRGHDFPQCAVGANGSAERERAQ